MCSSFGPHDIWKNVHGFYCNNFSFLSNNDKKTINIKFRPIKDNTFITKHCLFNRFGEFEILENNEEVPNVLQLSENSDDLNTNNFINVIL